MREVSRSVSGVIAEIERDGKIFAVTRHGRVVALITPLPDRLVLEFNDVVRSEPPDDIDEPVEPVDLTPIEEELLLNASSTPTGFCEPFDEYPAPEVSRAKFKLEAVELFERSIAGGYRITKNGRRVARVLQCSRASGEATEAT